MYQVAEAIKINKMLPSWIMIWNFYKCQIFVYCTLVCGMTMHVHVHVRLSSAPTAHWTNRTLKQALQRFLNICYLLPSHQFVYRFRRKVKQKNFKSVNCAKNSKINITESFRFVFLPERQYTFFWKLFIEQKKWITTP